jgi:ketosteroid isomerase-like protein
MRSTSRYPVMWALVAVGLSASAFAPAAQSDPVRAAIEKQNAAFSAAFARGDIAAMAAAYTEDAIAFPPDAEMARGRAAIGALWQALRDAGGRSFTLTTVDLQSSGELVVEVGTAVTRIEPPGGAERSRSIKYVVVWKRQLDGSFKLFRDIWNGLPTAQ